MEYSYYLRLLQNYVICGLSVEFDSSKASGVGNYNYNSLISIDSVSGSQKTNVSEEKCSHIQEDD